MWPGRGPPAEGSGVRTDDLVKGVLLRAEHGGARVRQAGVSEKEEGIKRVQQTKVCRMLKPNGAPGCLASKWCVTACGGGSLVLGHALSSQPLTTVAFVTPC